MVNFRMLGPLIAIVLIVLVVLAAPWLNRPKKREIVLPDIGSPIASAMVIYDGREFSLNNVRVAAIINESSPEMPAKAEDVPSLKRMFPLVRVKAPVPFVIVVNDSPDAVEEIREIADRAGQNHELPKDAIDKLRRCNARLDISSAKSPVKITDKGMFIEAKTDLDPTTEPVMKVVRTLAASTKGLALDAVNGGWLVQ